MPVFPSQHEAAPMPAALKLTEVCDVDLKQPIEEGDATITTTEHSISKAHSDGSMTLVPCETN